MEEDEEEKQFAGMIYHHKYKFVSVIGGGGCSVTILTQLIEDPRQEYVLKMINMDDVDNKEKLKIEIEVHKILSANEYIITIIEHFIEGNTLTIVTEYAKNGDLLHEIRRKNLFSDAEILKLVIGIGNGVAHIHSKKIVHRDLKPGNIFLTEDGSPRIGDFGISRVLSGEDRTIISRHCTPDYAPPEQLRQFKFTQAGDIWSLGIILYELCTGHRPFGGLDGDAKRQTIINIDPDFSVLHGRNSLLIVLIKSMLDKISSNRPNITNVLSTEITTLFYNLYLEALQLMYRQAVSSHLNVRMQTEIITETSRPLLHNHPVLNSGIVKINIEERGLIDQEDSYIIQELKRGKRLDKVKMTIFEYSNLVKWMGFSLSVFALFDLIIYITELIPSSIRFNALDFQKPDIITLMYMDSILFHHYHRYNHLAAYLLIDLLSYTFKLTVGILTYILASKLKRTNVLIIIYLFSAYLIFLITRLCILPLADLSITRKIKYVLQNTISLFVIIEVVLIFAVLQICNYNKLKEKRNSKFTVQLTKDPLHKFSNYVEGGIGIALLVFGLTNLIFSINHLVSVFMDGESFDSLGFLFLIYKGLGQIYGGIVCKLLYGVYYAFLSHDCLIAIFSVIIAHIYYSQVKESGSLERKLFQKQL